ncbi:MAG: hypothetical protein Q7R58_00415 [bacterium]|nr:hypothetical protein [bacterium]
MIRGTLTCITFISTVLFPWSLTVVLTLVASLFEPLVPLSIGLFADTLYYAPQSGTIPLFTLYGACATALAFFVRARLKTSIIRE